MRAVLSAPTAFKFWGRSEYFEDLVAPLDARLDDVRVELDRLDSFQLPQISLFIARTENSSGMRKQNLVLEKLHSNLINLITYMGNFNPFDLIFLFHLIRTVRYPRCTRGPYARSNFQYVFQCGSSLHPCQ